MSAARQPALRGTGPGGEAPRGLGGGLRGSEAALLALPQVEYFNNATIVDLVERPHRGILAVLDEACSTAGPITDRIFLQTLDTHHRHHPHYTSRQVPPPRGHPTLMQSRHGRAPNRHHTACLGWTTVVARPPLQDCPPPSGL